jgi:hypothetical protein
MSDQTNRVLKEIKTGLHVPHLVIKYNVIYMIPKTPTASDQSLFEEGIRRSVSGFNQHAHNVKVCIPFFSNSPPEIPSEATFKKEMMHSFLCLVITEYTKFESMWKFFLVSKSLVFNLSWIMTQKKNLCFGRQALFQIHLYGAGAAVGLIG